jgi:serine protease AprX
VPVIVGYDDEAAAARAVTNLGGEVGQPLSIVESFAATVPLEKLDSLRQSAGVLNVVPDGSVRLKGGKWSADGPPISMYNVAKQAGAVDVWKMKDLAGNPVTGTGIGVALIDSGVSPVKGLADPTRVINGPDLSFESQDPNTRYLDTFGHGTHMASIILGRDPEVAVGKEDDPTKFEGMAPGAKLISLKVATADGATDVSQVIAAIDWVVMHRNDPGLNIRVLNLSFGTDSTQSATLDPLSHAVEAAWRKGIVVVVSVGNDGLAGSTVSMPAANPYVISVGAADGMGTDGRADDTVATYSSVGNINRHADLVALGRSIIGLRDPGSYVDVNYPTGLVPGDTTGRFFRGSGTSQAAAVMSGAVALLLQKRPTLTPDQVKALLMDKAEPMPKGTIYAKGSGQLDIKAAIGAATPTTTQTFTASKGTGSLEASRGSAHVADIDTYVELTGEKDIMGRTWNAATWAAAASAGTAWAGGTWNGAGWAGSTYGGYSFAGQTWCTLGWSGTNWAGRTWSSRTWSGAYWDGRTWSSRTWSGRTWSGRTWSGDYWS